MGGRGASGTSSGARLSRAAAGNITCASRRSGRPAARPVDRPAARRRYLDLADSAARSSWSTSGDPGAARAGPRRRTWSRSYGDQGTGRSFVGVNTARRPRAGECVRQRGTESPTRASTTRTARVGAGVPRRPPHARVPRHPGDRPGRQRCARAVYRGGSQGASSHLVEQVAAEEDRGWARASPAASPRGPLLLAIAVAAMAGLVSFLSPCVLPLVPGYLSYVTGLAGADLAASATARAGCWPARLLFVAGFGGVRRARAVFAGFGRAAAAGRTSGRRAILGVVLLLAIAAGLARAAPGPDAGAADPTATGRRAGRRAGVRGGVRPVLDPVHRPDPRGGAGAGYGRWAAGRAAVLAVGVHASGLGLPFVVVRAGLPVG